MEQVVAQWWCQVASGVALDMSHWAMLSVLLQCACMAIKITCNGGALIFATPFFAYHNCS